MSLQPIGGDVVAVGILAGNTYKQPGKSWAKSPTRYAVILYRAQRPSRGGAWLWKRLRELDSEWSADRAAATAGRLATEHGAALVPGARHNQPASGTVAIVMRERLETRAAELIATLEAIPAPIRRRAPRARVLRIEEAQDG